MKRMLGIALFALAACSKDPPNYDPAVDKPKPAEPIRTKVQPKTRWLWITSSGGTFLAYYYVDKQAGPSAKGGRVSDDPPNEAELKKAVDMPSMTLRAPAPRDCRAVTEAEVATMKLPLRPQWLDIFEPAGTTPPPMPLVDGEGRPPPPKLTPGGPLQIQLACGPSAGGTWMLGEKSTLTIGSAPRNGANDRGQMEGDDILPTHMTFRNAADGASIEPAPGAKIQINGKDIAAKTPIAPTDKISVGARTLVVRGPDWMNETVGPDPSCPGYAERLSIEDACSMYGTSYTQIIGGDELMVGNDYPPRTGLPKDHGASAPVRAKLKNTGGKITFDAVDPKRPPSVNGKPTAHGVLEAGQQITTGDRVFVVCTADMKKGVSDTPLKSCPEYAVKEKEKAANKNRPPP